jgi:chorismate synthase
MLKERFMDSNTFGRIFRLTTYGESHGPGLGGIVDGCPAGLALSEEDIQQELDARRPGAGGRGEAAGTARNEPDRVRLLSGVFEGLTTGTPIAFHVDNTDQRSGDYSALARVFRPGHADLGFLAKYGLRDHRGGGRSSGRETVSRVAGGAIAAKFLHTLGMVVRACTREVGGIAASLDDSAGAASRPWFCPDPHTAARWDALAETARKQGDSLGGLVRVEILGLPAGLGEPVFDKLDARLAYAMMSVGAVKGVEIGRGFAAARLKGSENNDPLLPASGDSDFAASHGFIAASGTLPGGAGYGFASNNAGGVLGGMSSGAPVVITVAVKPIASIGREQQSVDTDGKAARITAGGRHDICAIPRVVPVLKAMAALCAADFILLQRCARRC